MKAKGKMMNAKFYRRAAWALLLFTFAFCLLPFRSFAPSVNFRIMDESGTNALRSSVRFFSLTNPSQSSTNSFAIRDFVRANTNSPLTVNLHEGRWRITVGALSWTIEVPATNPPAGSYEATDLADANVLRLDDAATSGSVLILD